jgi:hypothetical protein
LSVHGGKSEPQADVAESRRHALAPITNFLKAETVSRRVKMTPWREAPPACNPVRFLFASQRLNLPTDPMIRF